MALANLRSPRVSGRPCLRNENDRTRRGALKLLTHDLPVLTYAKGNFQRFNLMGVWEHLNVGTSLLERQVESNTRDARVPTASYSALLTVWGPREWTAHSMEGKVGQEIKDHKKADIGRNDDTSDNGILKML